MPNQKNSLYTRFFKRLIDVLVAGLLLIITLPLLILTALALAIANNGKVLFRQVRPGYKGKLFTIYKFKTMTDAVDTNGELLPDAERLTKTGNFIRKTSLDELPQLINVLKGDLSLIGPRPLLPEYVPLYSPDQMRRHNVKPGITGWAQVNGRNAISWPQKFKYDAWYVDHISFKVDLKILGMTISNVLTGHGISAEGSATMEKFRGNESSNSHEL
jgi:lipopolysaccharide/colanic/teichoic acid biosynthesis glycosyltransferase